MPPAHRPHRGKLKKPRTYRERDRKQFLAIAKSKKVWKSKMRKAISKQLGYLGRNLKTIDKLSQITSFFVKNMASVYPDLPLAEHLPRLKSVNRYENKSVRMSLIVSRLKENLDKANT